MWNDFPQRTELFNYVTPTSSTAAMTTMMTCLISSKSITFLLHFTRNRDRAFGSIECDLFGSLPPSDKCLFSYFAPLLRLQFNSIQRTISSLYTYIYVNYTWSFAAYAYQSCFFFHLTARSAVSLNIPRIITWKSDYRLSQDASSDTRRCEMALYNCSNWCVNRDFDDERYSFIASSLSFSISFSMETWK